MARRFTHFLVHAQIGCNRRLSRLTPEERWCFVAGVLALAAESPVRGCLLISEGVPADAADVAGQAGVSEAVGERTLGELERLGTLVRDAQQGCLRVVSWDTHNPAPRPSDSREATRERKRRQRARQRQAGQQADDEGRSPQMTLGSGGSALKVIDGQLRQGPRAQRRAAAVAAHNAAVDRMVQAVDAKPDAEARHVVQQAMSLVTDWRATGRLSTAAPLEGQVEAWLREWYPHMLREAA